MDSIADRCEILAHHQPGRRDGHEHDQTSVEDIIDAISQAALGVNVGIRKYHAENLTNVIGTQLMICLASIK